MNTSARANPNAPHNQKFNLKSPNKSGKMLATIARQKNITEATLKEKGKAK